MPKNEPRTHCTGWHAPKNEPRTHCRGVSTRQGALQPLWGVKKAGNSALPITATHTPCVSRNSSVRGMSSTYVQAWGPGLGLGSGLGLEKVLGTLRTPFQCISLPNLRAGMGSLLPLQALFAGQRPVVG